MKLKSGKKRRRLRRSARQLRMALPDPGRLPRRSRYHLRSPARRSSRMRKPKSSRRLPRHQQRRRGPSGPLSLRAQLPLKLQCPFLPRYLCRLKPRSSNLRSQHQLLHLSSRNEMWPLPPARFNDHPWRLRPKQRRPPSQLYRLWRLHRQPGRNKDSNHPVVPVKCCNLPSVQAMAQVSRL